MSIVEEDGDDIKLTIPRFTVDVHFTVPNPLPNQSFYMCAIGPPRSGKSSLITGLLTTSTPRKLYNGVFDHIYYFCPEGSFNSMDPNPYKALHASKINFEFDEKTFGEVIAKVEANAKKKQNSLIIVDDFSANLKDVSLRKTFEKAVNNRRHKRLSIINIAQTYRAIPLSVRKLITHLFLFKVNNLRELESIRDELVPRDRNEFQRIYNYIFAPSSDPHTFMYIDVSSGEIYKNFRRLTTKTN
jgi:hypothetical protein